MESCRSSVVPEKVAKALWVPSSPHHHPKGAPWQAEQFSTVGSAVVVS